MSTAEIIYQYATPSFKIPWKRLPITSKKVWRARARMVERLLLETGWQRPDRSIVYLYGPARDCWKPRRFATVTRSRAAKGSVEVKVKLERKPKGN